MPFITVPQSPIYHQISLDEIISGEVDLATIVTPNYTNTRTTYKQWIPYKFMRNFDFPSIIAELEEFNQRYSALFDVERSTLYRKFFIPKKSGGLREINAPNVELMTALRELKMLLEGKMLASYHTTAFAYVKGRCTVDAVKRHQQNESKWFVKLDFSNFFGSTTEAFVYNMFSDIFPFCQITVSERGANALKKALSLCFLNGGLPQGTPISPFLTNVMMIPIDHQISNDLRREDAHYIYTRYADDMLISSRVDFDPHSIELYVLGVLDKYRAPFSLNTSKTRYGSSAGRNWNLGVMLNKDNQITIGYKNKRQFKAMCTSYINDNKNDNPWEKHDVQVFAGLLSYYRMIEKEYFDHIIEQYNQKFLFDIEARIKQDLR